MTARLHLPAGLERTLVVMAADAWAGAAIGRSLVLGEEWWWIPPLSGALWWAQRTWRVPAFAAVVLVVAGLASGASSGLREVATLETPVPNGPIDGVVELRSDPHQGPFGGVVIRAALGDVPVILTSDRAFGSAGEHWQVTGVLSGAPGRFRGQPHAGELAVRRAAVVSRGHALAVGANAVRERVISQYSSGGSPAGLVRGFLIGETSGITEADMVAMRSSGLSHYVAVSGSNVALFLGLWWIATAWVGAGPRRRAAVGLVGLVLFVWITRWEPSVVRASAMAGLVLASRAVGMPLSGWSALALAVSGIVMVSAELVASVGFQLSVAATAGVMAGHRLIRARWIGLLASATIGAQLAVAPLLLLHFGSVSLIAPLTNGLAGPMVVGSTALGVVGAATAWPWATAAAELLAAGVLSIARVGALFPSAGPGVVAVGAVVATAWHLAPVRVAAIGAAVVWLVVGWLSPPPVDSGIVFLDVGQGDAILLLGERSGVVLVDGGPDGTIILDKLQRYGVSAIDLVINTHPHADHIAGLERVIERHPVGMLWHAGYGDERSHSLIDAARRRGVPALVPQPGTSADIGGVSLEVLGPQRRYASPNDQSVVAVATVNGATVALTGDIEVVAQRDLGPIEAMILKVPHQGAATSDPGWLTASAGNLAVVSVGPNSFGHPHPDTLAVLQSAGADVVRTDQAGDVVIRSWRDVAGG